MEEKIIKLLEELNEYAENVDYYEYGLPLYDDRIKDMSEIVLKFLMTIRI